MTFQACPARAACQRSSRDGTRPRRGLPARHLTSWVGGIGADHFPGERSPLRATLPFIAESGEFPSSRRKTRCPIMASRRCRVDLAPYGHDDDNSASLSSPHRFGRDRRSGRTLKSRSWRRLSVLLIKCVNEKESRALGSAALHTYTRSRRGADERPWTKVLIDRSGIRRPRIPSVLHIDGRSTAFTGRRSTAKSTSRTAVAIRAPARTPSLESVRRAPHSRLGRLRARHAHVRPPRPPHRCLAAGAACQAQRRLRILKHALRSNKLESSIRHSGRTPISNDDRLRHHRPIRRRPRKAANAAALIASARNKMSGLPERRQWARCARTTARRRRHGLPAPRSRARVLAEAGTASPALRRPPALCLRSRCWN